MATLPARARPLRGRSWARRTCRTSADHIIESDLIRLRTREGMKVAKAKGRLRGKQPKLNPRQEAHLLALHRTGEHSTAELGDLFGVGRSARG